MRIEREICEKILKKGCFYIDFPTQDFHEVLTSIYQLINPGLESVTYPHRWLFPSRKFIEL